MRKGNTISVVIPALNEQEALGKVLRDIPSWVDEVVVADNGSTDRTPEVAKENGAKVVYEPEKGYGAACMKAIAALDAIMDLAKTQETTDTSKMLKAADMVTDFVKEANKNS